MEQDFKPQLCTSLFTGVPCDRKTCPYLHLKDFQITLGDVCQLDDVFALDEVAKGDDTIQIKFSARDQEILRGPRPVLCWVCMKPIHATSDFFCSCCDVWICTDCEDKWPFPKHCPKCGKKDAAEPAPDDKAAAVSKVNQAILVPELLEDTFI